MRRAFTLIELLVIIAIIGIMSTVGALSLTAGKGAARVKGATRDIFAAIRHARTTALVTGQPAIITYSTEEVDGEVMAKIRIDSAKLFDSSVDRSKVQTLTGEPVRGADDDGQFELVHIEKAEKGEKTSKSPKAARGAESGTTEGEPAEGESAGETIEEILFAPISVDIVKGMRIKVLTGDEMLEVGETQRPSKISVFSNVDYLLGRFKSAKEEARRKEAAEKADADGKTPASAEELQAEVSVVWETNGRVDPHQVWVYADGEKPEDGLSIKIDRFGAAKVLRGDGKDED